MAQKLFDDGFFTEENGYGKPGVQEPDLFWYILLRHMRMANSDAFSGANTTAQNLAKNFIIIVFLSQIFRMWQCSFQMQM